jgi:hypothetical protein
MTDEQDDMNIFLANVAIDKLTEIFDVDPDAIYVNKEYEDKDGDDDGNGFRDTSRNKCLTNKRLISTQLNLSMNTFNSRMSDKTRENFSHLSRFNIHISFDKQSEEFSLDCSVKDSNSKNSDDFTRSDFTFKAGGKKFLKIRKKFSDLVKKISYHEEIEKPLKNKENYVSIMKIIFPTFLDNLILGDQHGESSTKEEDSK